MRDEYSYIGDMIPASDATALDLLPKKVCWDGRYDFWGYKRGAVARRLRRRLYATGARAYLEYMEFLDAHPEEHQRLADDLTVKVSGFFRSPNTFQQVNRLVLPELVSDKRDRGQQSLSIWSTACARGEEPYSIAILLAEFLGHRLRDFNIAIYASDISMAALKDAQAGLYSLKEIDGLSDTILDNYFTRSGEGYVVSTDIRRMVNFFYFDLVSPKTPSFMNLDCIFCCNVFIYLQKQLQESA
jgi:two-component system CheB/CheR fusion protein